MDIKKALLVKSLGDLLIITADKERDKPPPPSQNQTIPQKSKASVFIVGDSMIKKVDGYLLTSSLKH